MGRQLALFVGNPPSRGKIALAILPDKTPLATLLDAAFLVVVLWVIGAALAVQFAF